MGSINREFVDFGCKVRSYYFTTLIFFGEYSSFSCHIYAMDLEYYGIYRMAELDHFHLPKSVTDLVLTKHTIECLLKIKVRNTTFSCTLAQHIYISLGCCYQDTSKHQQAQIWAIASKSQVSTPPALCKLRAKQSAKNEGLGQQPIDSHLLFFIFIFYFFH